MGLNKAQFSVASVSISVGPAADCGGDRVLTMSGAPGKVGPSCTRRSRPAESSRVTAPE